MSWRWFVPVRGLQQIWEDDQEWRDVSNLSFLAVIMYNSVILTALIFLGFWLIWRVQ